MKDPAFEAEREWRIIHKLRPSDIRSMVYRQRQTLMSRHIPFNYQKRDGDGSPPLLPIQKIVVGPSRHKLVSQTSVYDLLRTQGYPASKPTVEPSKIPFQQY